MTTAEQATRQVENIIREMLTERFNDTFVFNPIIVIPRVDHDGDYYLHAYIVFDGDQAQLLPLSRAGWSLTHAPSAGLRWRLDLD